MGGTTRSRARRARALPVVSPLGGGRDRDHLAKGRREALELVPLLPGLDLLDVRRGLKSESLVLGRRPAARRRSKRQARQRTLAAAIHMDQIAMVEDHNLAVHDAVQADRTFRVRLSPCRDQLLGGAVNIARMAPTVATGPNQVARLFDGLHQRGVADRRLGKEHFSYPGGGQHAGHSEVDYSTGVDRAQLADLRRTSLWAASGIYGQDAIVGQSPAPQ